MTDPYRNPTLDLFSNPQQPPKEPVVNAPHQSGSQTSKAAARRIESKSQAMRVNVRNAIISAGARGMTRRELETVTGYLTQTLCGRLNELEEIGAIRKQTRLNRDNEEEVMKRDHCAIYISTRKDVAA